MGPAVLDRVRGSLPQAAEWAVRNKWFGTDTEMTEAAYDVHDALMAEGVDPASDVYYGEIERRVTLHFPAKMAQLRRAHAGGSSRRAHDTNNNARRRGSARAGAGEV